jgi:hypothetical protein
MAVPMKRDTEKAFRWIVGILRRKKVRFQIVGGLAARVYGAHRELADIDIILPMEKILDILPSVKDYLSFGPGIYRDKSWNLFMVTLHYAGQEIDICAIETIKIFNRVTKEWEALENTLSQPKKKKIFGILTPVVPREKLLSYKAKLLRRVDKSDINEITYGSTKKSN